MTFKSLLKIDRSIVNSQDTTKEGLVVKVTPFHTVDERQTISVKQKLNGSKDTRVIFQEYEQQHPLLHTINLIEEAEERKCFAKNTLPNNKDSQMETFYQELSPLWKASSNYLDPERSNIIKNYEKPSTNDTQLSIYCQLCGKVIKGADMAETKSTNSIKAITSRHKSYKRNSFCENCAGIKKGVPKNRLMEPVPKTQFCEEITKVPTFKNKNSISNRSIRIGGWNYFDDETILAFSKIPVHCGKCNQIFSRGNILLREFVKQAISSPFTYRSEDKYIMLCTICNEQFATRLSVADHLLFHNEEGHFLCEGCQCFEKKQFLYKSPTIGNGISFQSTSLSLPKPQECVKCKNVIERPDLLPLALISCSRKHTRAKCNLCDFTMLSTTSIEKHFHRHITKRDILCNDCVINEKQL